MEFGLGEALPLYAGGLGILAGDHLKTGSDLGMPAVGVGLLYQVGYFRQVVDAAGRQQELYPYNDPTSLPIQPVPGPAGGWLHVPLELPARSLLLRVWQDRYCRAAFDGLGISMGELLALGRADPMDRNKPFTMAYLALRGSATSNGVSRLLGAVSAGAFSRASIPAGPNARSPWAT